MLCGHGSHKGKQQLPRLAYATVFSQITSSNVQKYSSTQKLKHHLLCVQICSMVYEEKKNESKCYQNITNNTIFWPQLLRRWIKCYPPDKSLSSYNHQENQLHYPHDRDLAGGWRYPPFEQLEPGLQFIFFLFHTRNSK